MTSSLVPTHNNNNVREERRRPGRIIAARNGRTHPRQENPIKHTSQHALPSTQERIESSGRRQLMAPDWGECGLPLRRCHWLPCRGRRSGGATQPQRAWLPPWACQRYCRWCRPWSCSTRAKMRLGDEEVWVNGTEKGGKTRWISALCVCAWDWNRPLSAGDVEETGWKVWSEIYGHPSRHVPSRPL